MKKFFAIILSASLISGCSAFGGGKQKLSIMTNVDNAEIYMNGQKIATGNTTVKVKRNKDVQLMAKKEGYQTAYTHVSTTLSTLGILDLIGGCVIILPFFGLLFPGSKELQASHVALDLEKK